MSAFRPLSARFSPFWDVNDLDSVRMTALRSEADIADGIRTTATDVG